MGAYWGERRRSMRTLISRRARRSQAKRARDPRVDCATILATPRPTNRALRQRSKPLACAENECVPNDGVRLRVVGERMRERYGPKPERCGDRHDAEHNEKKERKPRDCSWPPQRGGDHAAASIAVHASQEIAPADNATVCVRAASLASPDAASATTRPCACDQFEECRGDRKPAALPDVQAATPSTRISADVAAAGSDHRVHHHTGAGDRLPDRRYITGGAMRGATACKCSKRASRSRASASFRRARRDQPLAPRAASPRARHQRMLTSPICSTGTPKRP